MNKVTTINLNGRAYQIEEAGYAALEKYLSEARAKLNENPDADEIMADFEQAIADKCDRRISSHKNVVATREIEDIIAQMGPVDGGRGTAAAGGAEDAGADGSAAGGAVSLGADTTAGAGPRRLYQIREGSWITGVCNGLAAYFNVDVALVRVVFVVLGALTHGFWILIYIILMIVMPVARTDDEKARAHGEASFNAHDFIEQAKIRYSEFQKAHPHAPPPPSDPHNRESWRAWKQEMKNWKRELKEDLRSRHDAHRAARYSDWADRFKESTLYAWQNSPAVAAGTGFFRFVMGLIIAGLAVLWVLSIVSVARYGTVFGYAIAAGHPLWISIAFLCALFYVIAMPFKLLMRNARPWHWGRYSFFNDLVQSIFFVFAIYLLIYTGRELFPVVNEAWGVVVLYAHSLLK